MRTFTDVEQRLMRFMVSQKSNKDFHSLEIAKIIRNELGIVAMRRDEQSVTLCDSEEIENDLFFKFADILNLIRELEQNNFIVISRSCDITLKEEQVYFDRVKYLDIYSVKNRLLTLIDKDKQEEYNKSVLRIGFGNCVNLNAHRLFGDIATLFFKYGNGTLLPLPALEDLVNNDFKDMEQRRFEKTQCTTWSAILISMLIGVGSLLMPTYCSKPTELNTDQVKQIKTAIESTKTEYPTTIDVSLQDTITVKNIETKQIINNIHINNEQTKDAQPE